MADPTTDDAASKAAKTPPAAKPLTPPASAAVEADKGAQGFALLSTQPGVRSAEDFAKATQEVKDANHSTALATLGYAKDAADADKLAISTNRGAALEDTISDGPEQRDETSGFVRQGESIAALGPNTRTFPLQHQAPSADGADHVFVNQPFGSEATLVDTTTGAATYQPKTPAHMLGAHGPRFEERREERREARRQAMNPAEPVA